MAQDPFFAVKRDVEAAVSNAELLFESWKRISKTVSSPQNLELQRAADELKATIAAMESDVNDLHETINVVETDPVRYGLDDDQVQARRMFVTHVRTTITDMRSELDKPVERFTIKHEYAQQYIENEEQQQQMLFAEQEETLDGVYGTVRNLREQADTMNRELGTHSILLEELDGNVESTGQKLRKAMGKVTYILKTEESRSSCYIVILIIILVILLIVAIIV